MMKLEIFFFLFLSLSSLFHFANPTCIPRNSSNAYLYTSFPLPPPTLTPKINSSPSSSPSHSPLLSPDSSPSPSPSTSPKLSPSSSSAPSPRAFLADNPSPTPTSSPSPTSFWDEKQSLPPISPPSVTRIPFRTKGPSLSLFSLPLTKFASFTTSILSSGLKNDVEGMCSHTDHPDLCLSSINFLLPAFETVDAKTLLTLEMKACQNQTEIARAQATKLANEGSTPSFRSILQACIENFDDALDNLDAAIKALSEEDKETLNIMLSALIEDYGTCEDGFVEMSETSPMASYDDLLTKLASNCLALIDLIKF